MIIKITSSSEMSEAIETGFACLLGHNDIYKNKNNLISRTRYFQTEKVLNPKEAS